MAWKDPEKQRAAVRQHYYKNKEMYIQKAMRQKQALREFVAEIKESSPCSDCGAHYPHYVMDFDHVGAKRMNISLMINRGSAKMVKEEIKNCELVCANCHRIRTHRRQLKVNSV